MKRRIGIRGLTALAAAVLSAGCWGTDLSQSVSLTDGGGVATTATPVGINACVNCHATSAENGVSIFETWKGSRHSANAATYEAFAADNTCGGARCHDPQGDGLLLDRVAGGGTVRPVVGCEACHGGGSLHNGIGPMAYPVPGASNCGQCHNASSPSAACLAARPDPNALGGKGNRGIYESWSSAPHSRSLSAGIQDPADPARVKAVCGRCHADQGARRYGAVDNLAAIAADPARYPALADAGPVQCRTCHRAHGSGVSLLKGATASASAGYNTCVTCHQEKASFHDPATDAVNGNLGYTIADTHFDNGIRKLKSPLQGYVMRKGERTGCTECHNPHNQGLEEAREWHASLHGDFAGLGWVYYDFKASNRAACQRCHTTTGFVNYTTNPTGYDPAGNSFGMTDNQAEMLYCRGCHVIDPATGITVERRRPAVALIPKGPGLADNLAVTGKGDSMLCLNCHSGQVAGSRLPAIIGNNGNPLDMDNTHFGSFNSHYLAAAMTLFQDNTGTGTGGYQFAGRKYGHDTAGYGSRGFLHDVVGTPSDPSAGVVAGDNAHGPCAGCHMSSPRVAGDVDSGSHSFLPFRYDNRKEKTLVTAVTGAKCAGCHNLAGGIDTRLTPDRVNALRARHEARVAELKAAFVALGIHYDPLGYPYFFNNDNVAQHLLRDPQAFYVRWQTAATGLGIPVADLVGAAFNLNVVNREPGAWAHNGVYASRLLYDSLAVLGRTPSAANWPAGRP
jgi:hypothetical protein